jgi:hypothetical protein
MEKLYFISMNKTNDRVPIPMVNQNDNAFSMDMDTHIKKVYQEQGYEAALTVMNDFLIMWEDCNIGPTVGQKTDARNPFFSVFVAYILPQWHKLPLFLHSRFPTCLEKSERV